MALLGNIGTQVKELMGAARKAPNVGGQTSATALKKAESVAIGAQRKLSSTSSIVSDGLAKLSPSRTVRSSGRGSDAGFKYAKSAHLTGNNSGYWNPSYHSARYSKTRINYPNVRPSYTGSVSYRRTTDLRQGINMYGAPATLRGLL